MTIAITVRTDNAIVLYEEGDPRVGVVIEGPADAAALINTLTNTAIGLYSEATWKRARMRAVVQALGDFNDRLN